MKTSEFIKKVEDMGYEVVKYDNCIEIYSRYNSVAVVLKDEVKALDTSWDGYVSDELFDILVEYARTPIKERKDVKKYRLYNPVKKSYFNYYIEKNVYDWFDSNKSLGIQTQFTEEEIKNNTYRDIMELLVKEEVE